MMVIPVDKVVFKKIIIGKNGGPRRRRGTRGC
jgi:GTPase Era involved in 16S rRNA processing